MKKIHIAGSLALAICAAVAPSVWAASEPAAPDDAAASAISPPIVSREKWKAKPAVPGLMKEQKITGIILHHTAVRKNFQTSIENKLRNLQAFSQQPGRVSPTHTKPGWGDVPYHFYVGASGMVAEGRDVRYAGDTNTKYDTSGYIQVVIEGDFDKEMPEAAQLAATRDLLVWLMHTYDVPVKNIGIHKGHAQTSCPGSNFVAALPKLLADVAAQSKRVVNDACSRPPSWPGAHEGCERQPLDKRAEPASMPSADRPQEVVQNR